MVEALQNLRASAPPEWVGDVDRAIASAQVKAWETVWDRMQAAAWANHDTPFGAAAELLRARAEQLSLASWRPSPAAKPSGGMRAW